jgi:hypothetical protein
MVKGRHALGLWGGRFVGVARRVDFGQSCPDETGDD